MGKNSRLVYSTDKGRIPAAQEALQHPVEGDGIVRIRRETKGRGGKAVTLIWGLEMDKSSLSELCKQLKQSCGTGGTVKDSTIEIQGDHRDKIKVALEAQGMTVKLAGG